MIFKMIKKYIKKKLNCKIFGVYEESNYLQLTFFFHFLNLMIKNELHTLFRRDKLKQNEWYE